MTPIDIQVSRSKVKVKGHASLLHLVQLITQEPWSYQAGQNVNRTDRQDDSFTLSKNFVLQRGDFLFTGDINISVAIMIYNYN